MRAKEKHKHTKNDEEKRTGITKYTCQKQIDEGHSIERVWYSASREPSTTILRFLALFRLPSALPDPILVPVPVIVVPVPIPATVLTSVPVPVPVPIRCSSTGPHPRPCPRSRPVLLRSPPPPFPFPFPLRPRPHDRSRPRYRLRSYPRLQSRPRPRSLLAVPRTWLPSRYDALVHTPLCMQCMYVCMVITYSRVWINRVRLPILLVVS